MPSQSSLTSRKRAPRPRPRVALCAAITFDGKVDASDPLPDVLLDILAPAAGDVFLIDPATGRKLPSKRAYPTRTIRPSDVPGLPRVLHPSPGESPVRRWLCLGGPKLFRALLDADLVNDLYLLVRPKIDGRRTAPTLSGPFNPEFFPRSIPCRLRRMEVSGDEWFIHYTVSRPTVRRTP